MVMGKTKTELNQSQGELAIPGEAAFPCNDPWQSGMSLRDWFAGMALSGFCACPENIDFPAIKAYRLADMMLAESGR
jgi:hypothetical protein